MYSILLLNNNFYKFNYNSIFIGLTWVLHITFPTITILIQNQETK